MYDRSLVATAGSRLTLDCDGSRRTVDLYSREGLELIAGLWVKLSAEFRLMYEHTWLGVPIIQVPTDIVVLQELIWKLRPDFIVECGLAHGGSAILYASICELAGKGRVIGVDVEVRQHNRVALRSHPLAHRIEIVEGSSIDPATAAAVRSAVRGASTVLVVLDSNHSASHVRRELELYHEMVTPASYLVAMDGAQADVWDVPRGKAEWRTDNPLVAIRDFLGRHPEFREDPYPTRGLWTSCPHGFLRRSTAEEMRCPSVVERETAEVAS